jgi:hypothetical protein
MEAFENQKLKPIRIDKIFPATAVRDAFRYMQQGKHIGKIVLEIREEAGTLLVENIDRKYRSTVQLDGSASYLLIGGLGGLGRSISVFMVQRGARNLTFLSRSAGHGQHDAEFVQEIESMGCKVQLVQGDVTNALDVERAIDGTPAPLKGIIQMSMVLRDQMFGSMTEEDWYAVTRPKVNGTWNLHNVTQARDIALDFLILFSSLSGVVGQIGQANYASANTFMDAFVQYRTSMSLPCTAIQLGAMEGVGYLSDNQELLRKMQGSGWRAVQEIELLESLDLAMKSDHEVSSTRVPQTFILGFAPTIPLSSPESSARLRRDIRMATYHNVNSTAAQASTSNDLLRVFIGGLKNDPSPLESDASVSLLAGEIGKKLCSLLLLSDSEIDISRSTSDMGLDSLVAVELRGWWKLAFGSDLSTLEMLSMGTLEALGKRAVDGLKLLYGS